MGFKLIIGMEQKEINKPTVRDVNLAIDALDPDHIDPFIILENTKNNNKMPYMQVILNNNSNEENEYLIEFRQGNDNEFKHYKKITNVKSKIKNYFEVFLLNNILPAPDSWENITFEMLDYYNKHDYFNILDIAVANHRIDKKIIDCHGFSHGDTLKEIAIYQYIAEAIILCKTVLKAGNALGEFYYTEDKKYFYMDIWFPTNWKIFIPDVYRIRGLLSDKMIQISSYNEKNSFIEADVKPLEKYEKLLTCLLLVFVRYLITDDNIIFTAMNYFCTSEKKIFIDIYSNFVDNHRSSNFYISYIDADDFDHSNYLSLSDLNNNFIKNNEQCTTKKREGEHF